MQEIKAILETAISAPSGDNCQPWQFAINGKHLNIFNLPERDISLFNFRQRASLVAHGALIENILIASSALGFHAGLKTFPDKSNPNHIATIELNEAEPVDEPLYPYIKQRATNRKPYKDMPLSLEQRDKILHMAADLNSTAVRLTKTPLEKNEIADAISINDSIAFENRHIHKFLFDHIRWTEREALQTGDGLYVRTLELPAGQLMGFKLLKNWQIVRVLNKLGIPGIIARNAKTLCRSASAIGVITANSDSDISYLSCGRLVQRVWLEAARIGLSFHPMTGVTFLIQRMLSGETGGLSGRHIRRLENANERIRHVFGLKNETMAMTFRIGYSSPPSTRSLRFDLDTVVRK